MDGKVGAWLVVILAIVFTPTILQVLAGVVDNAWVVVTKGGLLLIIIYVLYKLFHHHDTSYDDERHIE